MKSWTARVLLNSKSKLKFISARFKTHGAKLIVTSGSIISLGFAYYHYSYKNNGVHLCHTRELDLLDDNTIFDDSLETKIKKCNQIIKRYKDEFGIPGIIVGVSKNGDVVYSKGFGYADVENNVKAHANTVVRIASISKPITCTVAAKLFESGKLDIDKSIEYYLNDIPRLTWENKPVKISARQLMSHVSGIRHYKDPNLESEHKDKNEIIERVYAEDLKSYKSIKVLQAPVDTSFSEFFQNKNYKTTRDALEIFIHDNLMFEPGKGYLYTTYGFTLLSAVMEKSNDDMPFSDMLIEFFRTLKMNETYLDLNNPIIPNRAKFYLRNGKGRLLNVPYVDNSYKWAGGGILSTVLDLLKYGNHMLDFYQNGLEENDLYLKSSTIKSHVWATQSCPPDKKSDKLRKEPLASQDDILTYGLGWHLCISKENKLRYVYHTGGAAGATSCIMIIPSSDKPTNNKHVEGIVVTVLCNIQDVSEIVKLTSNISKIFLDEKNF